MTLCVSARIPRPGRYIGQDLVKSALKLPLLLLSVAMLTASARADSLVSLPEPNYATAAQNPQQQALPSSISHIVYPTIGLPSLVAPGEELAPVVWLPNVGATTDWRARLET